MEKRVDLANFFLLMEMCMRENGKRMFDLEQESLSAQSIQQKVNSRTTSPMAKYPLNIKMGTNIMER